MLERLLLAIALGVAAYVFYKLIVLIQRRRVERVQTGRDRHDTPYILYFRSDTCTSCATQSRLFYQSDLADIVHKIDVDHQADKASQYGVMTVPTLLVMDTQGKARYIHYGIVHPRKLKKQLETLD